MGEYEDNKSEVVEVLRSIRSIDDLKEKKDIMIDSQEKFIRSAVETLKDFFENLPNYSPEEKKAQVERFSDEKFIFDDEINNEMTRIYGLPGCSEYMDAVDPEMQTRLEPLVNEYINLLQTKMMEVMNELMGFVEPVMDAMAQGIGSAVGEMQKVAQEMEEIMDDEFYDPPSEVGEFSPGLPSYLNLRSVDELKDGKDGLFDYVDEDIVEKCENINIMFDMQFDKGEIGNNIKKLMKTRTVTKEEVAKLFGRIQDRTDDSEYIDSVRNEFEERMKSNEVKIREVKRRFTRS